jgi:hypothetical protein
MSELDTNAWAVLSKLLEMASDEFSRHGCNDFELPNTPHNRMLVEAMERWNSVKQFEAEGLNISEDGRTIYTMDWFLFSYFAHLARELAAPPPERAETGTEDN